MHTVAAPLDSTSERNVLAASICDMVVLQCQAKSVVNRRGGKRKSCSSLHAIELSSPRLAVLSPDRVVGRRMFLKHGWLGWYILFLLPSGFHARVCGNRQAGHCAGLQYAHMCLEESQLTFTVRVRVGGLGNRTPFLGDEGHSWTEKSFAQKYYSGPRNTPSLGIGRPVPQSPYVVDRSWNKATLDRLMVLNT